MKHFYAELDTRMQDNTGCIDLWRFESKKERDTFVSNKENANTILAEDAKDEHTEQFRYWTNND